MKRLLIVLLALVAALTGVSCNRDKNKLPDGTDKVSEYNAVPSFKAVFLALDKVEPGDLDALKPTTFAPAPQDSLHSAFAWGALAADAQLAVAGRNTNWLNSILVQLKTLAPVMHRQTSLVNKLEQSIKPLLAEDNWEQIKQLFYDLQTTTDKMLMEQNRWNVYTLAALGSWTQSVNQIGSLIAKSYSTEKSLVLKSTAWESLADNLLLINSPELTQAYTKTQELRDIMNSAGQNAFTLEQVTMIVAATDSIRQSLSTP